MTDMTPDERVAALWKLYADSFPGTDPRTAFALGVASYRPGQRDAGAALGSGNQINIFDLTPFSNGWKEARLQNP